MSFLVTSSLVRITVQHPADLRWIRAHNGNEYDARLSNYWERHRAMSRPVGVSLYNPAGADFGHHCIEDRLDLCTHRTLHWYRGKYSIIQYNTIQYNTIQYNTIQYNTIQYNTTSFISNKVHNYITTAIFTQHWDGWKWGGSKNHLIVVHPQCTPMEHSYDASPKLNNIYRYNYI